MRQATFIGDQELGKVGFMSDGVYINAAPKGQRGSRFATLLRALVVRDVTSRYRRSALGMWWAFLQPVILMLLFNMLRGFVNIPSDGLPYVLFSYAALVPWTFFTNAVAACGPSIITNAEVIKKIALPREVFPLAAVAATLFDFCMSGIVLAGMMIWFRVSVGWALLWLPILIVSYGCNLIRGGNTPCRLGHIQKGFYFCDSVSHSGVAVCDAGNLPTEHCTGKLAVSIYAQSDGRGDRGFSQRAAESYSPAHGGPGDLCHSDSDFTGDFLAGFPQAVRIFCGCSVRRHVR